MMLMYDWYHLFLRFDNTKIFYGHVLVCLHGCVEKERERKTAAEKDGERERSEDQRQKTMRILYHD